MKASTGTIGWALAVSVGLLAAACGGKSPKEAVADSAAAAAEAPAEQPNAQTPAAAPVGQAAPETKTPPVERKSAPSKPAQRAPSTTGSTSGAATPAKEATGAGTATGSGAASTPETAAPAYVELDVATGTRIHGTLDKKLSTQISKVGEPFTLTVSDPISVAGRVAIPRGAKVDGKVTAVQKSGGAGQTAVLKVDFPSVTVGGRSYPISADLAEASPQKKSRTSTGQAAAEVGAGAVAGALLGRIVGGNKTGTFIGAAVGAAAGTAIVLGTQDVDAVLPAGSPMTLVLKEPVTVRRPR